MLWKVRRRPVVSDFRTTRADAVGEDERLVREVDSFWGGEGHIQVEVVERGGHVT
jgi:hypothetical protein